MHSFKPAESYKCARIHGMKLSTRARYGLQCMLAVSRSGDETHPESLENVSRVTGKSKRYLEQIALGLKRANLLRAVSGRRGGYYLAKPADQIKLLEIVEATIGSINIVDCVMESEECRLSPDCSFRRLYMLLNRSIIELFERYTLADLGNNDLMEELTREIRTEIDGDTEEKARSGEVPCGFLPEPL